MKHRFEDDLLVIELDPECGIADVETDIGVLAPLISNVKSIELRIGKVKEIDTAYFQMLLSLRNTAREKTIPFDIAGNSSAVREICTIYGVYL